jgi:hypothetical protein
VSEQLPERPNLSADDFAALVLELGAKVYSSLTASQGRIDTMERERAGVVADLDDLREVLRKFDARLGLLDAKVAELTARGSGPGDQTKNG